MVMIIVVVRTVVTMVTIVAVVAVTVRMAALSVAHTNRRLKRSRL